MQNVRKEGGFDRLPNQPSRELHFNDFTKNEFLGVGLPAIVIIKDKDRLARSQRLVQTHSEKKGFHGRATFRDYFPGFIYLTNLKTSIDTPDQSKWYQDHAEPRSISFVENDILLTAADAVHVFNTDSKQETVLRHPYFGNLHTSFATPDNTRFLVSSTGFDSLIEFDRTSRQETWRWTAWEHGYNRAANGSIVTENSREARKLRDAGSEVILIDDSTKKEGFGVPTAFRTTHVNEAIYDYDPHFILATLYHKGTIVRIDRNTGDSEVLMSGLKNPHAIQQDNGGYIVTDTSHGSWYQLNQDFTVRTKVNFTDFPGKPEELNGIEWVQYVSPLSNGLYVAADANRQAAWIFDPEKQEYNQITTPPEWSVQGILPINENQIDALVQWK